MGLVIKLIVFAAICLVTRAQLFPPLHHDLEEPNFEYFTETEHKTNNMCTETKAYEENVVIPSNYTVQERVKSWCFSFSLRCTKIVNVTKTINKTVSVLKTKTVLSCCKGYEKLNDDNCQAACSGGCVYGNCALPNLCECDEGWEGHNCTKECSPGTFGRECDDSCDCFNGATCDRFNGTCYCTPGYVGKYCETACDGRPVGGKCVNKCKCENGGHCRAKDGICDCPPGYNGHHCEEQCQEGTFGDICSGKCTCDVGKTEHCNPINGKCECVPGYKGDNCDKPCATGSWGRQCDNKCNCGPNGTCHHITGQCVCPPGWHGVNCEEKCPQGLFQQDCKMKCPDCPHEPGTCHHVTGWCNCPAGVTGPYCHLECPVGKYGSNCEEFCLCNNNSTCDSITGECSCLPGWIGTECSMPCPEGTYGVNCSISCNCSNTDFCDSTTGSCTNVDTLINIHESDSFISPVYMNAILGFFGFIFIAFILILVTYTLSKLPYFSNLYQNMRTRFQGGILFKTSDMKNDDSSTTNVFQEDVSSINPSGQFMNPMYEATAAIENAVSRPTSSVHPVNGIIKPNQKTQIEDILEEVDFAIPEPIYNDPPSTPREKSDVRISFGSDFQSCSVAPIPVIKYSNSGKTYFFNKTENNSCDSADNVNAESEKHCYENITEAGTRQINKQ